MPSIWKGRIKTKPMSAAYGGTNSQITLSDTLTRCYGLALHLHLCSHTTHTFGRLWSLFTSTILQRYIYLRLVPSAHLVQVLVYQTSIPVGELVDREGPPHPVEGGSGGVPAHKSQVDELFWLPPRGLTSSIRNCKSC